MKDFASRLTAQAHDVSREVSQLLHDTRLTDAKIQSVTDYFLTLSDSQFIENVSLSYYIQYAYSLILSFSGILTNYQRSCFLFHQAYFLAHPRSKALKFSSFGKSDKLLLCK